jgi:hypothetical protein
MSLDLKIEALRISISNAHGQEHRLHHIALRAAALLGERLAETLPNAGMVSAPKAIDPIGVLEARPVNLNLNATGNDQAASAIANAWLQAVSPRVAPSTFLERSPRSWPL